MGYRSYVALTIRKAHGPAMLADQGIAQLLSEADDRLEDDGALLFHWDSIKWYHDDQEIAALDRFLSDLDEYDDYLFIRLGESDDDTEIQGGWWDNPFDLGYVRRIEFNNPSAVPARIADLKSLNTRPEAKVCAQCGAALNDPMPGLPSMKHCPVCEP
jgi:hypothetical protein